MNQIHNTKPLEVAHFHRIDINLYPLLLRFLNKKHFQSSPTVVYQPICGQSCFTTFASTTKMSCLCVVGKKMLPHLCWADLSADSNGFIRFKILRPSKILGHALQSIKIPFMMKLNPLFFLNWCITLHNESEYSVFEFQTWSKNMLADLSAQQIDFVIDLSTTVSKIYSLKTLIEDYFVVCTQQTKMNLSLYLSRHISVSLLGEQAYCLKIFYLQSPTIVRQIFLRCQHYATALQVLAAISKCHPDHSTKYP